VAITAPVPRPTHHLSGDGPTAEWHSRATLGLVRSSPVHIGKQSGTPTLLSLAAPNDGFTHRRLLRARSPFTRSCRCFCSAITELIRDQTPPNDFCNCLRRAGNQTLRLSFPRRDDGLDHLPFLTHHAFSLARAVLSGEPRDVRFEDPGAGSSRLREFAQPRYLQERPATAGFTRTMHSEDQRARVEGPSEGRVPFRMRRCLVPAFGAYA
jgi:hypothetical protein